MAASLVRRLSLRRVDEFQSKHFQPVHVDCGVEKSDAV